MNINDKFFVEIFPEWLNRLSPKVKDIDVSKYPDFVDSLFKKRGSENLDVEHAVMGIMTEATELQRGILDLEKSLVSNSDEDGIKNLLNVVEELGDLHFYIQALLKGDNFQRLEEMDFYLLWDMVPAEGNVISISKSLVSDVVCEAGDMLDIVKKHTIYGKDLDVKELQFHGQVVRNAVKLISVNMRIATEIVIKQNMLKLSKRYPSGIYKDSDAIGRKDKD